MGLEFVVARCCGAITVRNVSELRIEVLCTYCCYLRRTPGQVHLSVPSIY